jgi:hypothetical protein
MQEYSYKQEHSYNFKVGEVYITDKISYYFEVGDVFLVLACDPRTVKIYHLKGERKNKSKIEHFHPDNLVFLTLMK